MHNVEKSAFHKGQYVGYGAGTVWNIRKDGKSWRADDVYGNQNTKLAASLKDIAALIEVAAVRPNNIKPSRAKVAALLKAPAKKKRAKRKPAAKSNPIFADYSPGFGIEHMTGLHPTAGRRAPKMKLGLKYRVERNDKKAGWLTVATFAAVANAKEFAKSFANAHAATVRVVD